MKNICVFGSSSEELAQPFYTLAYALGTAIADAGLGMVFGGGRIGLMGAAAKGVASRGGSITGVIPEKLHQPGVAFPACTRLIVTETMHARKQAMEDYSDAFIAMPGGFGTLEELLEVITLKQLGYHAKPIIMINHADFYTPLLEQFETLFATGFSHPAYRSLYGVVQTAEQAVESILCHKPVDMPDKLQHTLQVLHSANT